MTLPCSRPDPDETAINKPLTFPSSYRPEIDGLRALAIIAVIINHFNADLLPNGFLGVDIFFVISGFVVTSSLSGKPNTSWKNYLLTFYTKRIKRLIPALVICVIVTAIVSCLVIDVDLVVTLLPTGAASLLGVSNLQLLHQNNNYFGQAAIFNPFTQTWSLGVEEQFYLIFPILLGLCGYSRQRRFGGNRNLILVISVLSFFSLVNYIYLFKTNTQAAFYLMPARFWELGAGCMMFLIVTYYSSSFLVRWQTTVMPLLYGLFLIGLFLWGGIDRAFATIVTVCLTCLLLWSFNQKGFWVSLLSSKKIVRVGLLSYSLYLWHWPVLIISRWTVGVSKWTSPILLILIIGIAMTSYHLIEQPLRYAQWSKARFKAIAYGVFATLVSASFLSALRHAPLKGKLYSSRYFPEQYLASFKLSKNYHPCRDAKLASKDLSECFHPSTISPSTLSPRIYFIGDSHTYSLQAMASRLIEKGNVAQIAMVAKDSCLFSFTLVDIKRWLGDLACRKSNRAFLTKVMETGKSGDIVVITNFYDAYFIPKSTLNPQPPAFLVPVSGAKLDKDKALEIYSKELVNIAQQLSQKGISLVVQSSLPTWKNKLWECQAHWFRPAASLPETCKLDASLESQDRLPLLQAFKKAAANSTNLHIYDPFPLFCNQDRCNHFSNDNVPLFRDENHLNNYGAEYLYSDFLAFLKTRSLL